MKKRLHGLDRVGNGSGERGFSGGVRKRRGGGELGKRSEERWRIERDKRGKMTNNPCPYSNSVSRKRNYCPRWAI